MDVDTNPTSVAAAEFRHRLRTPLNHLIGYGEMLREDYPSWSRSIEDILAESNLMLDALQQTAASDPSIITPAALTRLRHQMTGGIDRVSRTVRDLLKGMPEAAHADLERMSAAAASLETALTARAMAAAPATPSFSGDTRELSLEPTTGPGRILVVDDDSLNRDMLSRQLEKRGHSVAVAADGPSTLEMLREGRFDLVLLDVIMPGMNGFEVLQAIRADPALGRVAVILVSALDEIDIVVRCIEAGAEDYLLKPIDPTLLRARLKSTLDKLRAEETVRRKQRLESIGLLAAGIAHDFNNLLTGIIGNAQLLEQFMESPQDREMAESIVRAGERAAELTKQLLAYSGKASFQMQPIDLAALIRESEDLIRAGLPKRAQLQLRASNVPKIIADPNQIRQTILNLTLNAGEALSTAGQGSVIVETGVEEVNGEHFDVMPDQPAQGHFAWFEVRDNGTGMDAATVSKIFEPFFTTKFLGRGLGLAAVAGIVRSHRGYLRVRSEPEQGSAFRVYFPLNGAASASPDSSDGRKRVLVIDDETIVCQIVTMALQRAGFDVAVAQNGEAAIEMFQAAADRFPVALVDWKLPGMDGKETVARLRTISPAVKIIVSSGFARSEAAELFRETGIDDYLQKPYKMSELVAIVNKYLDVVPQER